MESPLAYPESPFDPDEAAFPCKGCGEILEEGKAFELAGNRWHIDCFRCNTCGTLLDGDANLLLLGDGSLICNNCTYSCSNCGNKIEDLAILTGDQAFCANCFKCRNCKKKIENLRYARTSQGIFCMDCHEALMARRRKKTARNAAQRQKIAANNSHLDKSLPSLPPSEAHKHAFTPSSDSPPSSSYSSNLGEAPSLAKQVEEMRKASERRERSPAGTANRDNLNIPATFTDPRHSLISQRSDQSGAEEFLIPVAFDPSTSFAPSQISAQKPPRVVEERPRDYFNHSKSEARVKDPASTSSNKASPSLGYQEKARQTSSDNAESLRRRFADGSGRSDSQTTSPRLNEDQPVQNADETQSSRAVQDEPSRGEKFKLQDVPKGKRSSGSARESGSQATTPRPDLLSDSTGHSALTTPTLQEPDTMYEQGASSPPRSSYEYSPAGSTESPKPLPHQHLKDLPKRGDSLDSSKRNKTIPRKELHAAATIPQAFTDLSHPTKPYVGDSSDHPTLSGGRLISKPIESPNSKSIFDTPNSQSLHPDPVTGEPPKELFVTPRAPPQPPTDSRARNESMSVIAETSKLGDAQISPSLPRWSAGGEFNMEEDMARIMGSEEPTAHESFLRRVSNSVRHGRSYSDKTTRLSRDRWPRSPGANNILSGQEISSPSTASPENRDELAWFKNELRRERQKTIEREKRIAELEATLDSTANIKQVNADLKEKRSTMVVLDAQKEIVVRELEVLTEHIAVAKKSGEPLDVNKMSNTILREFAEALQKLKDSFTPQIEESIQKRNNLFDEIANLTQMKDKSLQEFEQLSSKNAQLAELNNQLVHQIQGLYKANAGPGGDTNKPPQPQVANGLGIYSHHKDRSQVSFDSRITSELSTAGSSITIQAEEQEAAAAVMQGPHVVNIRKGQAKKFNWRKEGRNVAKGVKQGLKGAFSSSQQAFRDPQFAETAPYGSESLGQEYSTLPRNNQEPIKQGFGLFGNQKMPQKVNGLLKQSNSSTPSLLLDASTHLFGADLEQRAEYEKTSIPSIITRCIEEVEARGMNVEGIYRKSGGNSQVQQVREGFERNLVDFDLSDPDLDINAVTSALKQYFRKLPNPLITYDVYDRLLETTTVPEASLRTESMRQALNELPRVHYEVLEYLMQHLTRVAALEKQNLMTSMNLAVVFAPTIMRPESLGRELTDTKSKNEAVIWMMENVSTIFQK